jgi:FMN reductase
MTRTVAVVSAGLSEPSSTRLLADRLATAVTSGLPDLQPKAIDLRAHAHEITDNLLTGFPPAALREAIATVTGADGLIAVTPIFNASYSGLFKSFFDVLDQDSLAGKPVLIAATGGTPRHSLALEHALRPMFAYLHAIVVPTSVYAASEDWGGALSDRIDQAAAELADLIVTHPPKTAVDDFTPFEDLLNS